MNQIAEKQNQEKYIQYLAAQRQLYDEAKVWYGASLIIGIFIAVLGNGAFLAFDLEYAPALVALFAWLYALSEPFIFPHFASRKREDAARIQELFDCEVLELPWSEISIGYKPEPELIQKAHDRYLIKHSPEARDKLMNWYTNPELNTMNLGQGRVVCQRENIWWDAELRREYALKVIIATVILFILLLIVGVIADWSLREFLLGPLAFSLSILFIGLMHAVGHLQAAQRLDDLRDHANDLWKKAMEQAADEKELINLSRELQTQIFHHRSETIPVFSWYYDKLRDKFEKISRDSHKTN